MAFLIMYLFKTKLFLLFRFIQQYMEIESQNKELDENSIFAMAVEAMKGEGFILRSSEDIKQVCIMIIESTNIAVKPRSLQGL